MPGIHEALPYTNTMVNTTQTTPVESIYNTLEATEKMVAELIWVTPLTAFNVYYKCGTLGALLKVIQNSDANLLEEYVE